MKKTNFDLGARRFLSTVAIPAAGQADYFDSEVTGLMLRVFPSGRKSWAVRYTFDGRKRFLKIANAESLTCTEARKQARKLLGQVALGKDPATKKQEAREASKAPTVAELTEDWMEYAREHKRPLCVADDASMIKQHIAPALGHMRVADVGTDHVEKLHRSMGATPYRANRVLCLVKSMFNRAIRVKQWTAYNPCTPVRRNLEQPRHRYLSREEIDRLHAALNAYPNQRPVNVVRLLLFTGSRRSEALRARWADFDLTEGTWTKPASSVKQKRESRIPLNPAALNLLRALRAQSSPDAEYVFGGDADRPLYDLKRLWAFVQREAKLPGVRIHDLRHSFASVLASGGVSLQTIGALLGHSEIRTTERYSHLFDEALRTATDKAGALLNVERPALLN